MQTYYNRERKKGKQLTLLERCIIEANLKENKKASSYHSCYNWICETQKTTKGNRCKLIITEKEKKVNT